VLYVHIWPAPIRLRRRRSEAGSTGDATPFLPELSPLRRKSLTTEQDAGNLTSNGGLRLPTAQPCPLSGRDSTRRTV